MKASMYHQSWGDDPVLDKLAEYTETYPIEDTKLAELDWVCDDSDIDAFADIEEEIMRPFSEKALDAAFDGTLKVSHLVELCGLMEKKAKITTAPERERMRRYYRKNKHKIKRKAKMRRLKERHGAHRRKKRLGTAAGGYQFVQTADRGPKVQSGKAPKYSTKKAPKSGQDFNPVKHPKATDHQTKLESGT